MRRGDIGRWQLVDQRSNLPARARLTPGWRNLGQRQEDEGPINHARVRHIHTSGIGAAFAAVIEQVEIEHPRLPADVAHPAKFRFNRVQIDPAARAAPARSRPPPPN